jgi:hypothetical protein
MIRCAWCGAKNYAIDMWCSHCKQHLDWQPVRHRRIGRRAVGAFGALAAMAAVAMAVMPAAAKFDGTLLISAPTLSGTAATHQSARRSESSPPGAAILQPTRKPDRKIDAAPAPTPWQTPAPNPAALVAASLPPPAAPLALRPLTPDGNPMAAVDGFYQAVSAHQFGRATSLWSPAMQAAYAPSIYIDQRFADTQQIALTGQRIVSQEAGTAVVYVSLHEVAAGQSRDWVGTWQLIQTPSGWLLNSPDLTAG